MDKLNPVFQATPVTTQVARNPGSWYITETTSGYYTPSELAWLNAQGWKLYYTDALSHAPQVFYSLVRFRIEPSLVLHDLIADYTAAYNEGRQLNDQRYDDLVTLYTSVLDKTEDTFNANAALDTAHDALIRSIIAAMEAAYAAYALDVSNDLDSWGTSLVAEVNARFDAELAKAAQALIDRGLYTGLLSVNASASVERERTRALATTNDQIQVRKTELKQKVYGDGMEMRSRILSAYERLRSYLASALDRQVAVRNAAAEALGRLVEGREDGYPDLNEIGRLAASLGAGSPEAFAP